MPEDDLLLCGEHPIPQARAGIAVHPAEQPGRKRGLSAAAARPVPADQHSIGERVAGARRPLPSVVRIVSLKITHQ